MVINGGSANLTKRNIRDYTLDTNIRVKAPLDSELAMEIEQYFDMLWNNDENTYTINKENLKDGYLSNKILYEIQNISGFSTY